MPIDKKNIFIWNKNEKKLNILINIYSQNATQNKKIL